MYEAECYFSNMEGLSDKVLPESERKQVPRNRLDENSVIVSD